MKNPFRKKRDKSTVAWLLTEEAHDCLCVEGYTPLDQNPEILTACRRIAELIGSMTIYLMSNTEKGDVRIVNELSRLIDINPMPNMTRSTWVQGVVMTLLLYGKGNAVVRPHTYKGYLQSLEPISASRFSFVEEGYRDYKIVIDGFEKNPNNLLHFVYNPDKNYLWKGAGVTVSLRELAKSLKQADKTKNAFMASEWKPSLIVKVDALIDEFANPQGREKLLESYAKPAKEGQPWIIPAEQIDIEQVRPLTLSDLAINDTIELDKRTVASILGVPPFLLGVGEYNKDAWNSFIQNTIRPIALSIQQEMTKKLILSPNWYLKFNVRSLMDYDLKELSSVYGELRKQGVVDGNEVREAVGLSPRDGLDELVMLENYIPTDKLGDQKKLAGND